MDLTHASPPRVLPLALLLACALPASAQNGKERTFDPHALGHSYTEPAVAEGLDTSVLELSNSPEHNAVTDAGARLGRVLFYEIWDSRPHQEKYLAWRTETGLMDKLGPYLAAPPVISYYDKFDG